MLDCRAGAEQCDEGTLYLPADGGQDAVSELRQF
jgi:hypothetical protein